MKAANPDYAGPIEFVTDDDADIGCYEPSKHRLMVKRVSPSNCPVCHGQFAFAYFCPICETDCGCKSVG